MAAGRGAPVWSESQSIESSIVAPAIGAAKHALQSLRVCCCKAIQTPVRHDADMSWQALHRNHSSHFRPPAKELTPGVEHAVRCGSPEWSVGTSEHGDRRRPRELHSLVSVRIGAVHGRWAFV
ncbi:hypothetical protein ANO11243_002180 [Dothideomycetidae sp. 11243]|nr:hypothetical protein ANO11243_002180 [fungal sp. No.11243]